MMPREIQKAIEISKELYEIRSRNCGNIPPYALSEEAKALRILLEVAQSHLQASELPERRIIGTEDFKCGGCGECEGCKHYRDYGHYEDIGFNACLDLCTPILAKLRGEVEEKDKRIAELERRKYGGEGMKRRFWVMKCPAWFSRDFGWAVAYKDETGEEIFASLHIKRRWAEDYAKRLNETEKP